MRRNLVLVSMLLLAATVFAAELTKEAAAAFDNYVQSAEKRMQNDIASGKFFYVNTLPADQRDEAYAAAKRGEPKMIRVSTPDAPNAMIHDWVGVVFIPNVTLAQVRDFMTDYNVHGNYYKPDMTQSKLIAHNGDNYKIMFRLYKSKFGVTADIDVDMDVQYFYPSATRLYDIGHSTKVCEVANAGKPGERQLPPGNDRGLLWRLDSYWRAEERDGGVYVESEAITLTKNAMWPIGTFIKSAARESLEALLRDIRPAVPQHAKK